MAAGPPADLVRALVEGPSLVSGLEWHDDIDSTNRRGLEAAAEGVAEVHVVLADAQSAGRGRRGRRWLAPPGTGLLASLVLRPGLGPGERGLLPLLAGVAVADAVDPFVPGAEVALKWPNDVLVGGRKVAGVLVETAGDAAVVGVGLNVDCRGIARPPELAAATSLAEAAAGDVDRWRVLAAVVGLFCNRYAAWRRAPDAFLGDYRARCATLGRRVRVVRPGGEELEAHAVDVGPGGALRLRLPDGTTMQFAAGDVEHVR